MKVLGIETSCDETAAAVVEDGTKILANIVASSLPLHAKTGGIIPEIAAREQAKAIIPVVNLALANSLQTTDHRKKEVAVVSSRSAVDEIDAIAVTFGPGLIGSLLVGVETAKTLSYVWNKPLIPVNHLIGHLYAPWLDNPEPPKFPLIALIVSGGHTELLLVTGHGKWRSLGGTRDDAAGEAFDKTARVLGLGYPGGPAIEKAAVNGDPTRFGLPRPLINSPDFDFSFSGLKTSVVNLASKLKEKQNGQLNSQVVSDLAASIQEAVVDVLVRKTTKAAENFKVGGVVLGGGVAANRRLREKMVSKFSSQVYFSSPKLAVDNAATIASAAFFNYRPLDWEKVAVDASILI